MYGPDGPEPMSTWVSPFCLSSLRRAPITQGNTGAGLPDNMKQGPAWGGKSTMHGDK